MQIIWKKIGSEKMSDSVNPNNYGTCVRRVRILDGREVGAVTPSDGDYKIDSKPQIMGNKILVSYTNRQNKRDIIVETYKRREQSAQPDFYFGMDLADLLEKIESGRKAAHEGK